MAAVTPKDLAMFAQVNANHPRLLAFLQEELAASTKFMTQGRDIALIHRAQGEVTKLEKLIKLLTTAKDHLHAAR